MARRRSVSDEQILEVAREVFIEEGPSAATSQVAARVGLSEAAIFKRFGTKQRLFCEAVRPDGPVWVGELWRLAGRGELRETLVELVVALIAFYREVLPRLMLVWSSQVRTPEACAVGEGHPLVRTVRAVSALLEQEAALGRLVAHDAETVARGLLGASMHFAFSEFVGTAGVFEASDQAYARSLVGMLLEGIGGELDASVEPMGAVERRAVWSGGVLAAGGEDGSCAAGGGAERLVAGGGRR